MKFFNKENLVTIGLVVVAVTFASLWVIPTVTRWMTPKPAPTN